MSAETMPRCEFDQEELRVRMNLTIAADVASITPVVSGVMALVGEMGCAAGGEHEVETALREALTNAIVHGARRDAQKSIECCVACDASRGLLIVVRDPGPGFDPSQIPSPILGQNLYSNHGRGIFLINQLMDEVRFDRGGTEIVMRKNPAAARSQSI